MVGLPESDGTCELYCESDSCNEIVSLPITSAEPIRFAVGAQSTKESRVLSNLGVFLVADR